MKKILTLALIAAMMLSMIVVGTSAAAWDGTTVSESLKGEGTAEKPYLIETGADLAFLAKTVNEGEAYEGKYFTQTADIDLGNKEWTPIGNTNKPFKGVYDGCNKNITGFYIAANTTNAIGFFGAVYPSYTAEVGVANVNLKGAIALGETIKDSDAIGGLVAWGYKDSDNMKENSLNIINCVVDVDITITNCAKQPRLGGVMGYMFTGRIENVEYKGTINYTGATGNSRVGGIIGQGNRFVATNVVNNGEINVEHTANGSNVGGIIGMQTYKSDPVTQYVNCVNNGKITVTNAAAEKKNYVGGIVGGIYSSGDMYNADIKNCLNTGDISATTTAENGINHVAGILAYANKRWMNVIDCVNTGLVTAIGGVSAAGGIGGTLEVVESPFFTVKNCLTLGNLAGLMTCTAENNKENVAQAELDAAAKVITDALTKSAIRINGFPTSDVPLPETTQAPETTQKPETTKAPDTTKAPETTQAPTEAPVETTKAPVTTEAPKSSGGCGSIVGGGLAVVALVGIAVIVSKKKD